MSDIWRAEIYSRFLTERTRPAYDLLAAIPETCQPTLVYDLGCGPGNSTVLLAERWPDAEVIGVDSSLDMLKQAEKAHPNIHFIEADIAHFSPLKKADLLFSNAALQWLNAHESLFATLANALSPGGILAVQMPNNYHRPSHQAILQVLQDEPDWAPYLKALAYGVMTTPRYSLPQYYDLLTRVGLIISEVWETTYYHEMPSHQAIYDWMKGTGLRPVLSLMSEESTRQAFERAYVAAIAAKYPYQVNDQVLLPFDRIFLVASRHLPGAAAS